MKSSSGLMISFMLIIVLFIVVIYFIVKQTGIKRIRLQSKEIAMWLLIWVLIQNIFTVSGLYSNYPNSKPPYIFLFGLLPSLAFIALLFFTKKGKYFTQSIPLEYITVIQMFRIPVEFVLVFLFFEKLIPKQMTFLGSNFDILIGITAPIFAYLYFRKSKISRMALLVWNFVGVFFLFYIVLVAFFSAPSPFQSINFNQPNVAILHFPYALLATIIVPILLYCHLVSIKRLWVSKNEDEETTIAASQLYKTERIA